MRTISIHDMHREVLASVVSPGFEAAPPDVTNADLIPPAVLEAMSPGWFAGNFAEQKIHVVKLFDVYLTGEGLLFNSEKDVVLESITQYTEDAIIAARARVLAASDCPVEWGKAVLLRKRGDANYGHWFVETLPKLWIAEQYTDLDVCVVPGIGGPMRSVIDTSLALSGASHRIMKHNDAEVIFFKQLIFVHGLTNHGTYMSPLVFSKTDMIAPRRPQVRKLFVSRKGAARDLFNEEEVINRLLPFGFEIVHPGHLTLRDQIDIFSTATHVVGVMGAGMTNIMFCAPNTRIVNIAPASFPDTFFYFISLHRKLSYKEIRGRNVGNGEGWDCLFEVVPSQIVDCL